MKRNLLWAICLTLTFLLSCTKEDGSKDIYLDNKIIEGLWIGTPGPDSMSYHFTANGVDHEYYAFIVGEPKRKLIDSLHLKSYLLTDSLIVFPERPDRNLKYRLSKDDENVAYINDPYPWAEMLRVKQ